MGKEQELSDAIYGGDPSVIEAMLKAGADPNGVNHSGSPHLLIAVLQNEAEMVRVLLAAGATVDSQPPVLDYVIPGSEVEALLQGAGASEVSEEVVYDPRDGLRVLAWSGFYTESEIIAELEEIDYDTGDMSAKAVRSFVADELKTRAQQESKWPATTDCDRLDRAFAALRDAGIVALHNAGTTQSDGISDCHQALAARGSKGRGYVFYTSQDVERVLREEALWLAFGGKGVDAATIAKEVQAALNAQGLKTTWSGSPDERLCATPFAWQRRGFSDRWRNLG